MKVISEETRQEMNQALHDQIITDMRAGDTTVLFEIIERMSSTDVYYALSDEYQETIKLLQL